MARYKGNLEQAVRGVTELDRLKDGDVVLISEGCTTSFSSHRLLTVLSVIRNLNLLKSLTTGKTSYLNSTSLLM